MWQGKGIPARTEVSFGQLSPKTITSTVSPLPNLPGEVHTEEEWGLTKPVIETDPDLILPLMIRSRRMLKIEAGLNYVIAEDGSTDKIDLWGASSEGAVRVALDLISERKYKPAKVRELPVRMQYRQILNFQSLEKPIDALAGAVDIVDPAYPYERLLAGDEGYAVVKFTLTGEGKVESTVLLEASHPDFGGALIAAVESWSFKPEAAAEGGAVREYRHDFVLSQTPYASRRLIADVRAGEVVSNSSAGLDAKPKILARPGLAYPTVFYSEKVAGSAEVEFIVDRVGLAQLPRVLKATKPEFGWAAVTLVNGMRFTPMTRGGKPTELRVRMPVQFTPPKPEAPAAGG
jgi:TonB family protein